jgi:hypothetical protein
MRTVAMLVTHMTHYLIAKMTVENSAPLAIKVLGKMRRP